MIIVNGIIGRNIDEIINMGEDLKDRLYINNEGTKTPAINVST